MALTVKQKWFAYTVLLLGAGLCVQLIVSYVVQRAGATFATRAWFTTVSTAAHDAHQRAVRSGLEAAATRVTTRAGARASDDTLEAELTAELGSRVDRTPFWAVVDADGRTTRTTEPACSPTIAHRMRGGAWAGGPVLGCAGRVVLATYRALGEPAGSGVVVGVVLDDHYASDLASVTGAETVIVVDREIRASSFRDTAGATLPIAIDPMVLDEAARSPELAFAFDGHVPAGYRGFGGAAQGHHPVAPSDPWYYGARRLDSEERVSLVVAAPVKFMTMGATYSTAATGALSVVLLALIAALVRKLVTRFTEPLVALTTSARAVAQGDLTMKVPTPSEVEMREFCETYNAMLESMAELLELRQRLAREAGMADVASSVLHNIGNVLNSVNVSMSLASDYARSSRSSGITKLSKLLEQNSGDLATFFTRDPRGKKVPEYLRTLGGELDAERERLAAELSTASDGVEHIKRIVAAQQRYAKPSAAISERCRIDDIVADALKMSASTFGYEGVELVHELVGADVDVDRHKLLQIIVNLVTNAKQAVLGKADGGRRVTIRTASLDGGRVRVSVEDNGVGVAPEHQAKIFAHGFTTKPDGHGIGLHACAIAATEMGGTLSFQSEGRGAGAEFVLELPAAPQQPQGH